MPVRVFRESVVAALALSTAACHAPAHGQADPFGWHEAPASAPNMRQDDDHQEPRGAEDYRAEDSVVRIAEPMVFDLVRGLGAEQGEVEVNVLGLAPIESGTDRDFLWAPEIEAAIFDGFALEFELPFAGSTLEAYKLAAQYTFGTADNKFIHGTQLIVEKTRHASIWDTTLLYIPGYRFDETFSAISMIGFRTASGSDLRDSTELIFNLTGFADVGDRTTIGIETNYASGLRDTEAALLLMPQIHLELLQRVIIQAGAGPLFTESDTFGEAAFRLVYTF